MPYTWQQFLDAVDTLLTVDASRLGTEDYRAQMKRQAVIELQNHIPAYRIGHETLYLPSDFVSEGSASRAVLPPQAELRDVFMVKLNPDSTVALPVSLTDDLVEDMLDNSADEGPDDTTANYRDCQRFPAIDYPWSERFALVHGLQSLGAQNALVAIDPQAYTFYLYPQVTDGWVVSLFWDGLKLNFKPDEETSFDEGMVMAVAEYVKAKLAREVDHDLTLHDSYMGSYRMKRTELYITAKDRGRLK